MEKEIVNNIFEKFEWKFAIFEEQTQLEFRKIDDLKMFIDQEIKAWGNYTSGRIAEIRSYYKNLESQYNQIDSYFAQGRSDLVENCIRNIHSSLIQSSGFPRIISSSKIGIFLLSLDQSNINQIAGATEYFSGTFNPNGVKDYIDGVIKAFILSNPNVINEEFGNLLNKYKEHINHLEKLVNHYNEDYNKVINNIKNYSDQNKTKLDSDLYGLRSTIEKVQNEELSKFTDIRKLYEEKIRIEGPANYWETLEKYHEKKGKLWRCWAVGTSTISILIMSLIFFNYPDKYLNGVSNSFTLDSIKGTLLAGVIISILVYLIRFFIKLSVSSYHLALDAKERYQLSHFYLSLIKEGALQKEERTLIIQALFGRADTGLLQGESAPTLPVDIGLFKKG
ncbi:hypothetical protein EHQ86_18580 [Leptospira yasudae]|nr:hypothetical protein EHQ86_18580 [Leptospira yasudae]